MEGANNASNVNNIAVLNPVQFAMLYHKKVIDKIIFPREIYFETQKEMLRNIKIFNIDMNNVCIAARLKSSINIERFIELYPTVRYLPHIEFRIAEHCNLNCKMCTEYCALVTKPTFMSLEKFAQDFQQLHKFIDDFSAIRILGGEPLLNPEINEYIKVCRNLYPESPLHVVTNAILLQKMSDIFFDTVRQNNAIICISSYPPLQNKMPEIQRFLTEKNVQFSIGQPIKYFAKSQTLQRNNQPQEIFKQCVFAQCHNLCDGKIAACFLPFTTQYFNAYYNKNLPEDGALDLYSEGLTTEKLKAHLLKPFERCCYCAKFSWNKWETVKHPSPITDWIIN